MPCRLGTIYVSQCQRLLLTENLLEQGVKLFLRMKKCSRLIPLSGLPPPGQDHLQAWIYTESTCLSFPVRWAWAVYCQSPKEYARPQWAVRHRFWQCEGRPYLFLRHHLLPHQYSIQAHCAPWNLLAYLPGQGDLPLPPGGELHGPYLFLWSTQWTGLSA